MLQSFWILAAVFLTTLTYVFVKMAPEGIWFGDIFFVRSVFLFAVSLALVTLHRIPIRSTHTPWHGMRATVGISALLLNIITVQHLPVATAQTLAFTAPLLLACYLVVRARLSGHTINYMLVGTILIGFAGICLVMRPSFDSGNLLFALLALLSAVCTAITSVVLKHLGTAREPTPLTVFFFSSCCLAVASLLHLAFSTQSVVSLFSEPVLLLVGLCTVGSELSQTQGWGRGKTLFCANLQFSAIIFSTGLGWLVFDETFDVMTYLGIALIFATEIASTTIQMRAAQKERLH